MAINTDLDVELLDATAARDPVFVDQLTDMVNEVYADGERGLWVAGTTRTTTAELAELISARQVAVARSSEGRVVGSVHVHQAAADSAELGMLVAALDLRGVGIGRSLVEFAERQSREQGRRTMQVQLLVPRAWQHPTKEFLSAWYRRLGYRIVRIGRLDDAHPHLAPCLATPCDLQLWEKPL